MDWMCQQGHLRRGMSTGNTLSCWSQHPRSQWGVKRKTIRKRVSWQGWEHRNNITGKQSMGKDGRGHRHKVGQQASWTSYFLIAPSALQILPKHYLICAPHPQGIEVLLTHPIPLHTERFTCIQPYVSPALIVIPSSALIILVFLF